MAQLRNLGQPFGSPGGIINIPAPAGSQLAGQIQMQAMAGLGQGLGAYLGQGRQQQFLQQDIQDWQRAQQSQLPQGMVGPQMGMPQMQSRMGQQAQQRSQLGQMFPAPQDPFSLTPGAGRFTGAGQLVAEREPAPMQPTQQAAETKLNVYKRAKAIPPERRNKHQQAVVENYELGKPLVAVSIGDKAVTNTLALRREFQADSRVKDMRTIDKFTSNVKTAYNRSLTSKNLGPVDISLAKSFQKLTDLGSSVREGEFATTFAGQKLINKMRGKAEAVIKGGLGFTEEDRREIRDLVLVLQKDSQKMYNQAYDEFEVTADEFGFNKRAIFGGTKRFDISEVGQSGGLTPQQQGTPVTATNPQTGQKIQSFDGGQTWQPIK